MATTTPQHQDSTASQMMAAYPCPTPPIRLQQHSGRCVGKEQQAADVVAMCRRVVNCIGMKECSHGLLCALAQTPGAQGRLDYLHSVAGRSPASYLRRVLRAGMPEDYDAEFSQYIRLADFESDGELIDYVVSGLSRQGQYVMWGAQGLGYFNRGGGAEEEEQLH